MEFQTSFSGNDLSPPMDFYHPNPMEFDFPSMNSMTTLSSPEEFDFPPAPRDRANTWPQQQIHQASLDRPNNPTPVDNFVHPIEPQIVAPCPQAPMVESRPAEVIQFNGGGGPQSPGGNKKPQKSPHRNAWGDASYADLISQAIESTADKRMTLAQIYDWIMQNVPYFRDKGVEFSAGWKNSIRHNLSLRTRFIRCQNETAGKSSWWMIDPEVKAKKSSRPRAGSAGMVDHQRFRAKKFQNVSACKMIGSSNAESDIIDVVGLGDTQRQQGSFQWSKHIELNEPHHSAAHSVNGIYGKIPTAGDKFAHSRFSIYPTDLRHYMPSQSVSVSQSGDAQTYPSNLAELNQLANFDGGWMFPDDADAYPTLYEMGFNKLWQR